MEMLSTYLRKINLTMRATDARLLQIAAVIAAMMVLFWYNFIHLPLSASTRLAEAELGRTRAELTRLVNFQNAHLDMAAYEQAVTEADASASRALPSELMPSEFISIVQREALRAQVRLTSLAPGDVTELSELGVVELPITVTARAGYFQLLDFLGALADSPRFLLVKGMAIEQKDGELECQITIAIYARAPENKSPTT